MDDHNHALAALRYLISRLDARKMAGRRPMLIADADPLEQDSPAAARERLWRRMENEGLWTTNW